MADFTGYRIVSYSKEGGFVSLAAGVPLTLAVGAISEMPGPGLFLGTDMDFCLNYYTGLTDGDDVLLTYSFNSTDVTRGDPASPSGEVCVSRARLVAARNLSSPSMDLASMLQGPDPWVPGSGR
jgi:hypothetical protein